MIVPFIRNDNYNSLLDTSGVNGITKANHYIIIKGYMNRYDLPGGRGTVQDVGGISRNVVSWNSDSEFTAYCRNFQGVVETAWNNKLWLIPSINWWAEHNLLSRPNVRCCISIRLASAASEAHLNLRCVKLAAGESMHRSSMSRRGNSYPSDDIMGRGMRVEEWHARPWLRRINQHLRLSSGLPTWRATRHRRAPEWLGRQAELIIPPDL